MGLCSFFFFTLILFSNFRSFVGFGTTNREASTKRYTRAWPYLFVDVSLLNENLLRPFSSCTLQQFPEFKFSCRGLKGIRKIHLGLRFLLIASWSALSSRNHKRTRCSSWKCDSSKNLWPKEWFLIYRTSKIVKTFAAHKARETT